ncbi:MAG: hypothetical protein KKH98_09110 [Spirochaetes bacterium]|nr:hypothetical protein [Spirochaetota bacterium]
MIVLHEKNDEANISGNAALATLNWKTKVDLDLWAFYMKKGTEVPKKKGLFGKLFGGDDTHPISGFGSVGFRTPGRGTIDRFPFIHLDKDSGIGGTLAPGGFNQENINFAKISEHNVIIICANIFSKNTNFAQYGGNVTVTIGGEVLTVPLTETSTGSWCTVAMIDNRKPTGPVLRNINRTTKDQPNLIDFL